MIDISVVINLHREHLLLHKSLRSALAAMDAAAKRKLSVEAHLVVDRPDERTLEYIRSNALTRRFTEHIVDYGDLGQSRNHGVQVARGTCVAFLDGDDLWSENWLWRAHRSWAAATEPVVLHPESNLIFGEEQNYFYVHRDMDDADFDLDWLRVENYWTALSFAERTIYERHPFTANRLAEGIGYEDWSWNMLTIRHGIKHKAVPGTLHFVRRKGGASLLDLTNRSHNLPIWSPLFGGDQPARASAASPETTNAPAARDTATWLKARPSSR
jgi:glycosyltransferase involved in cell wall biosynthesis